MLGPVNAAGQGTGTVRDNQQLDLGDMTETTVSRGEAQEGRQGRISVGQILKEHMDLTSYIG